MLLHLARSNPKTYERIGRKRRLDMNNTALVTTQTVAMARMSGLNDTQLRKMRSFLKHMGNVDLKLSAKQLKEIDATVGIQETEPSVVFGSHAFEWATSSAKGKDKRAPELCEHWNADVLKEIASEIDLHLQCLFDIEQQVTVPTIDYIAPGFVDKGVVILFGGDHGDKSCPISAKINFMSPEERKKQNTINLQCPTIQIASVDCSKDAFELLQNTVMPRIREQLIRLQGSVAVVAFDVKEPTKRFKALLVPRSIDLPNVQFNDMVMGDTRALSMHCPCNHSLHGNTVDLSTFFDNNTLVADLRITICISNFHGLCVDDLAFQAMLVGMTNSSGS